MALRPCPPAAYPNLIRSRARTLDDELHLDDDRVVGH